MDRANFAELSAWLTEAGLAGKSETAMLDGFCRRAVAAGLPVARAMVIIDTLHPVHEGRVFRWRREGDEGHTEAIEYGPTDEGEAAESWRRSPFFRLVESGGSRLRIRLAAGQAAEFASVVAMQQEGMSDYLAIITRFAADGVIGEMDCVYSSWATDHPGGFDDGQVEALVGLLPMLALAVKCVSLARIAGTLVETYLGRDAGRRVLAGRIRRGVAETIHAVLWYSDLREFTRITDQAPPQQIIPFLNDYAEAVISAVYDNGGDVLKLIGDGTLAIFTADSAAEACRGAIAAQTAMQDRVAELNRRRAGDDLPTTQVYLGLHVGEVFYGNIGSSERLDFTVVGPAVNEVARIAAMCRSVERNVLVSQAFADAMARLERGRLVSVGRYALRGVEHPQELFTLDPFGAT
ncbi:MAG TPA: adenylate/guanylate cyclase domain-containing protein [Stellaceae bacterium]|jgi:adenylate cyclase|nr:adenylate/guanylate cyclase domain-containing protein [Stellaceae bacterium]